MREQLAGPEHRITTLETQLDEAQIALEKLMSESSRKKVDFCAQAVAVENALREKSAPVERPNPNIVAEAEKRQQLSAEL